MAREVAGIPARIVEIAEPLAAELGLEILDVEVGGSATSPVVRVLLDSPDESRRISIEDCQAVSRRLGDGLDAYEVLTGRYMLEVSSPGLNRPLRRAEHFRRVIGRTVRVRVKTSAPGERHTWAGRLDEVDETGIQVTDESGSPVRFEFADIDRANLEFEFGPKGQKKSDGHERTKKVRKSERKSSDRKKKRK